MTEQVKDCPQPESELLPCIQYPLVQLCRWGPRANPSATIDRDACGDYWVHTRNGQTRQFDTLELAFNYGDMQ